MTVADLFMVREAVISDCGNYRYLLRRAWDITKRGCLFVMLNPSTADAEVDDATIRSCIRLAKSWGYGHFEVVNLFGFRSTDPEGMGEAVDPTGPNNDRIAREAIGRCDVAICAWGAHWMAKARATPMVNLIREQRPTAYCVGTTKSGAPKHPLYIKSGTALSVFRPN